MPAATPLRERLGSLTAALMTIPGLSGHEGRVRRRLAKEMQALGLATKTDKIGNLIATAPGEVDRPTVMLLAHMDQLGFVVRKIEASGIIRLERLGGVPERALASQEVLICAAEGRDIRAVIANKSHHATSAEEKYRVLPYQEIMVDAGFSRAEEAIAAAIDIGSPVVYAPKAIALAGGRIAGTAVDDRAGCAVIVEALRHLVATSNRPTVHFVFSTQEEFNLRGALLAAQALAPDMQARGDVALGTGPAMSLYSFHGRGTLNGTMPHPALVALLEKSARSEQLTLQRSAQVGVLTDSSYVQLAHHGVAAIDLGFPCRYTHSSLEMCDLADLEGLVKLVVAAILRLKAGFSLDRDDYER